MSAQRTRRSRLDRCRRRKRRAPAVVHVVADAIGIGVFSAVNATLSKASTGFIAVAALRDVRTTALVDLAWTVADAASVKRAHAVVHVVTDAIGIGVFSAVTATLSKSVELVSIAVAVASGMSAQPHS